MGERRRLWALDGLRGLAALAVVAYHYLDRGPQLYPELGHAHSWIEWGQYGVQLFFIISGFVIFDSVKSSTTGHFFANRAIRLYPAYWLAVFLTFTVVLFFGLPGRETSLLVALFNLTMLEGFFGIPYVDGAYWTLAIELAFYVSIAVLARIGALADGRLITTLFVWIAAVLAMRGIGLVFHGNPVIDMLDGIASWLPLFVVGIALNIGHKSGRWIAPVAVIICAVAVTASRGLAVLPPLIVATALVVAAIVVRIPQGVRPFSNFLGELSYPVYLLHQNIGYVLLLWLASAGVPQLGAVAITAAVAISIGTIAAYAFDIPVRSRLRAALASRSALQPKRHG
ncbi:acyltransferase family protein [Mycobacterium sp. SMC-4]|uniref:acyltransferase family protein n=1 Tax=Mycobacterium sp. SMC-4 TaxID=2857059 RepID=UPI003D038E37